MSGDTGPDLYELSLALEQRLGVPPLICVNHKDALHRRWQIDPFTRPDLVRNRLRHHHGNTGTVMGAGRVGIDLDIYKPEGAETYRALTGLGWLPATACQHTQSGGLHLLYRYDPAVWDIGCGDFAKVAGPDGAPFPGGAEWKGTGGYLVVYEWDEAAIVDVHPALAEALSAGRSGRGASSKVLHPATLEACALLEAHFGGHHRVLATSADTKPYVKLTRPDKDAADGTSCTVGLVGDGTTKIWSKEWSPFDYEQVVDLWELRRMAGVDVPKITVPPVSYPRVSATFVSLADVVAEKVTWLWPGRLPLGKLVLLEGDPGVGKSTVSVDLAARTSTGGVMPDGFALERPTAVIIMSAEDGLADTIKPRLQAAAGDPRLVDAFTEVTETDRGVTTTRPPSLPGDLGLLEERVRVTGARLVIVDVLAAYLSGKVDTHKDSDVRRALHQLAAMAERTGACVVCLRHLTKAGGTKAVLRGVGSVGISGQARAVLLVVPYPDPDDGRLVLAVAKCNLAPLAPSLAFRLEDVTSHGCAIVAWGAPVGMTADQLLAASDSQQQPDDDGAKGARDEAKDFLRQLLADGDRWSVDIFTEAKDQRIAEKTLKRAKADIGVTSYQRPGVGGDPDRWYWHLPDEDPDTNP